MLRYLLLKQVDNLNIEFILVQWIGATDPSFFLFFALCGCTKYAFHSSKQHIIYYNNSYCNGLLQTEMLCDILEELIPMSIQVFIAYFLK